MRTLSRAAAFAAPLALGLALALPALADVDPCTVEPQTVTDQSWPWHGVFGKYDPKQLQRGFQVYHDVCANCHSLKLVAYRNLGGDDGIGLGDDDVKKIAAEAKVTDGPNDAGDMFQRPGKPSDRFVAPFPNDNAARAANGGALPPDMSLLTKAREDGPNYIYSVVTGFVDPPKDCKVADGKFYNKAFPGHLIGMPPPLSDGQVTYADGTKATMDQEARDIVAFLNWAAEPELNVRHNLGIKVLIFAGLLTLLAYALKRKIWADVH